MLGRLGNASETPLQAPVAGAESAAVSIALRESGDTATTGPTSGRSEETSRGMTNIFGVITSAVFSNRFPEMQLRQVLEGYCESTPGLPWSSVLRVRTWCPCTNLTA